MLVNRKPKQTAKVVPTQKAQNPQPVLPPQKMVLATPANIRKYHIRNKVCIPAALPKEVRYSFFQEMMIRMQMPTPTGRSIGQQLQDGTLKEISITFEQGTFVLRSS
jgi:hypothetical protein